MNIFAENVLLLCIFYSHSTLVACFVFPNGISAGVCSQRGFEIFFLCYRKHEQFVVPVTGCSPWDDFVALRCQAGQHTLAFGHVQVVENRGLIHSQLDQINWCYICHGKVRRKLAEQRNGIFSNVTVNFQGGCDDGIQLNMTINWKDRPELNWHGLLLSRLENSPDLFKYISC